MALPNLAAATDTARRLVEPVLAMVFPSRCPACSRALAHPTRGPLCEACWEGLPRHRGRLCGCGLPLPPALALCGRCRRGRQTFAAGVSLGPYEGGLRTVIHELKYRGKRRVAVRLAEALLAEPGTRELLRGSDVLVPVPLHPRRRRERGFNQAEVLAQELARRVGRRQGGLLTERIKRVSTTLLFGTVGLALLVSSTEAFGPIGQPFVLLKAIDTLPKPLGKFYKDHRLEMPSLTPEATFADKTPERRFELDRLMPFPFLDLPHSEAGLKARFGEDVGERIGRLPWLIQESHARLVQAFKEGERAKILEESDRLGVLLIDLHNPLSLTENSDGQKTMQHGLKARLPVRSR